jgi:hypothetical protein
VFGFSGEDRLFYSSGNETDGWQAIAIVDLVDGPTPAVQISEQLEPGWRITSGRFDADSSRVAYSISNAEQSSLSLLDLSVAQPSPWHLYDAPYGYDAPYYGGIISATIPEIGHIMPFIAPVSPNERRVFSLDLSDPNLPVTQLDAALPEGGIEAFYLGLAPDESQIVFENYAAGSEEVYMRVAIDGSSPIEPLYEPGWAIGTAMVLTAP